MLRNARKKLNNVNMFFIDEKAAGAFVVIVYVFIILIIMSIVYGGLMIGFNEIASNATSVDLNTSFTVAGDGVNYYQDPTVGKTYVDALVQSVLLVVFIAGSIWVLVQIQVQQ